MTTDGRVEAQFTVPAAETWAVTTGAGAATLTLTPGTYYHATFAPALQAALIAQVPLNIGTWSVTYSTGASGTGKYTIAVTVPASESLAIVFTTTTARNLIGFTGNVSATGSATGTNQARGLWIPDCAFNIDGHPSSAPIVTDARETESPTGDVFGLVGNVKYVHTNARWSMVAVNRTWIGAETIVNQSWERFCLDAVLGQGISWFARPANLQIYDIAGVKVGIYGNSGSGMAGWKPVGVKDVNPERWSQDGWTGLWKIVIPRLSTSA